MALQLKGVAPPIITPFKNDESLDLEALKACFKIWNGFDLDGYLVLGSNAESVFLDQEEKDRVVAAAREMIPAGRFMMVGAGEQSTRATVRAARRAAELGADCVLVVTPFYFKGQMSPDRLRAHYFRVAEASPVPVLLYNVPQMTGVNMSGETVAEIGGHENIVGIKDSSGNIGQLADIVRLRPEGFIVFTGSAPVFFPALCLGAEGGILAAANVAPEICVRIYGEVRAGQFEEARNLQEEMTPLAKMVTLKWGVGGLKEAMTMAGYPAGKARSPLAEPTDPEAPDILRGELEKLGLLPG